MQIDTRKSGRSGSEFHISTLTFQLFSWITVLDETLQRTGGNPAHWCFPRLSSREIIKETLF